MIGLLQGISAANASQAHPTNKFFSTQLCSFLLLNLLSSGKRHNQGVLYFKPEGYETTEKQLYRGSFKNDMYHGHGTLYWPGLLLFLCLFFLSFSSQLVVFTV